MSAVLWIAVEPKTDEDREKLARGLATLAAEDPRVQFNTDPMFGETIIGATWEWHLEVILDRLRREFNVEAFVGRPRIAYKEALTRAADGEMKYVSRVGEAGQYAHVKLHVLPGAPGTGFVFHNSVTGGAIPGEFIEPIKYGIENALARGVLAGYPVEDVRVELYDGSYHDIDSSPLAFTIAGGMAFEAAARQAGPVVLEPVMRVQVTVDDEYAEDVRDNLVSRRGENLSQHDHGDRQFISAWVPLAELFGYSHDLRERTRGRGTVVAVELVGYAPAPPLEDDDDRDSRVGAPRRPPSPLRTFGIALPEPDSDETAL